MIFANGYKVSEVICLRCYWRWIAARPTETNLFRLECPKCEMNGYAIETGEICFAEDLLRAISEQQDGTDGEPR